MSGETVSMATKKQEAKILKAISSLLSHDLLGLSIHDQEETSHLSQARWSNITESFKLKVSDSPYYDSLCAAFAKVHDYKYIDSPYFKIAVEADLKSMGIPTSAIEEALTAIDQIISELSESKPSERDAGWNPKMDEIRDITSNAHDRKIKQEEPHTGGGPAPEGKRKLQVESLQEEFDQQYEELGEEYPEEYEEHELEEAFRLLDRLREDGALTDEDVERYREWLHQGGINEIEPKVEHIIRKALRS